MVGVMRFDCRRVWDSADVDVKVSKTVTGNLKKLIFKTISP